MTQDDARRLIERYVDHDNTVRLHSAIGFVPADMLAGRQKEIHAARDRKLQEARRQRQLASATSGLKRGDTITTPGETKAGSRGIEPRDNPVGSARPDDRSAEALLSDR